MADLSKTMHFSVEKEQNNPARDTIKLVCSAMQEKGYDPVGQFVGYLISGDPTYITTHKNARTIVRRLDRDELMEEFISYYIKALGND